MEIKLKLIGLGILHSDVNNGDLLGFWYDCHLTVGQNMPLSKGLEEKIQLAARFLKWTIFGLSAIYVLLQLILVYSWQSLKINRKLLC